MAPWRGQEAGPGLSPELPDVRHGYRGVSLHPPGPHLGLRLLPGRGPGPGLRLQRPQPAPGDGGDPADPDTALPHQPRAEVLSNVLPVHPPAALSSHARRVRGLHWHHFTR